MKDQNHPWKKIHKTSTNEIIIIISKGVNCEMRLTKYQTKAGWQKLGTEGRGTDGAYVEIFKNGIYVVKI